MTTALRSRAESALARLTASLLEELGAEDHWTGELASSALSTAVATIALGEIDRARSRSDHQELIRRGLEWLAANQNSDGGWGDTTRSRTNLSTTALGWAAFGAARADSQFAGVVDAARSWIVRSVGSLDALVPAIEGRYGQDRTFSVPIVLTLALSERLGPGGWSRVRPLPFELAALPRSWFGALRLPVVSYALPALVALGQAIHHHARTRQFALRWIRERVADRTLNVLEQVQPPNGGFLEAIPLTAFVTMSLASMGLADHIVARRGAEFLRASVRPDGSWPIDTNLATWVTTLSVKALKHQRGVLPPETAERVREWLVRQQYRSRHPYTDAPPGGWAWTHLPGGVPDADDTAGALLAIHHLGASDPGTREAGANGVRWLLDLQNRDGGIPTFCRGWGHLPFDRSAPDLTAHAVRAWTTWEHVLPADLQRRVEASVQRACRYLLDSQRPNGSWVPLWFGNESAENEANPVYGTAQVLEAIRIPVGSSARAEEAHRRAVEFLCRAQNKDGGWGGDAGVHSSVEETSLALAALARQQGVASERERGLEWLLDQLEREPLPAAAPIGLYFARLWYWERMYPLIFAIDALGLLATSDLRVSGTSHD